MKKAFFLLDVCLKSRLQLQFSHNLRLSGATQQVTHFVFLDPCTKRPRGVLLSGTSPACVSDTLSPSEIFFLGIQKLRRWFVKFWIQQSNSHQSLHGTIVSMCFGHPSHLLRYFFLVKPAWILESDGWIQKFMTLIRKPLNSTIQFSPIAIWNNPFKCVIFFVGFA